MEPLSARDRGRFAVDDPLAQDLFEQAIGAHKAGRFDNARGLYAATVRADRRHFEAWNNLCCLYVQQGEWTTAIACGRQAVALRPDHFVMRMSLADAYWRACRFAEAREHLLVVVKLKPELIVAWYELAIVYLAAAEPKRAVACCDRALALDPEHVEARWIRALALLSSERFDEGFAGYEVRQARPGYRDLVVGPYDLPIPIWRGEPLLGKRLLILPEQGYGDVIQFARFVRALPRDAGRLIFYLPGNLIRLFQTSFDDLQIEFILHENHAQIPAADYKISLLSLGQYVNKVEGQAYLRAPPEGPRVVRSLGTRVTVGLCWAGNPKHEHDRQRNLELEMVVDALAQPGVALYSLQIGRTEHISPALLGPWGLVSHFPLRDFGDTARVIEQLDGVVTIDSAVAHLAGALGKPVHLLIPSIADWRWGTRDRTTVWYNSVRLHRQRPGEAWPTVLGRVAESLRR